MNKFFCFMMGSCLLPMMAPVALSQSNIQHPKLSIFNNGHVFVGQEYFFEKPDSVYILPIPESAVAGTYWLLSKTKDNEIRQLKYQYTTLPNANENDAILTALYKLNKHEIKIKTSQQSFFGWVKNINLQDSTVTFIQYGSKDSIQTIALRTIDRIEELSLEKNNAYNFHIPKIERKVNIVPYYADKKLELKEYFLRNNMNWYASTLFKIIDKNKADFIIRIVIENNLQDFKNADVNLLLNTPSIVDINKQDPLVQDRIINNVSQNTNVTAYKKAGNELRSMASRMVSADAMQENYEGEIQQIESIANSQAFSFKNISLNKDSKNAFIFYNQTIDYKNYYATHIPMNYFSAYKMGSTASQNTTTFFCVAFKNTTTNYIPTNTILFLDEHHDVISERNFQNLAPLAEVDFQLTPANDIVVKNREDIIKATLVKVLNANQKLYNYTIKGKIFIESFKKGKNSLQITKVLDQVSKINPQQTTFKENLRASPIAETVNEFDKNIQWNMSLDLNEKQTIEYEYEREQMQYE